MGFVLPFIVIAFWMWVVKKILDIDERTKDISRTLTEISNQINSREHI